jgi:general secretion pathway protein M
MALDPLPKPVRRAAALGLVVLALGLAALVAIGPFVRLAAVKDEVDAARVLLAQQQRLALAAASRPAQAGREPLIAGESSGIAGAELQRIVSELARQNGLALRSLQVAPAKREADLTVLAVEVSLQGGMEGLRALLHTLETGAPMLFIDALSVKSAAEKVAGRAVLLDVSLKVRGYGAGKDSN